jgi:hypothetical protein
VKESPTSDPLSREHQRIEFAKRLTLHRVRTRTIVELTGLTPNRLTGFRRRWKIPEETRLRGRYPQSLNIFLRTPESRAEAAAVLSLCSTLDAIPQRPRDYAPGGNFYIDIGMRILDAFEAYRAIRPKSEVEFDDVMILIRELVSGETIRLKKCKGCQAWTVFAVFDGTRPICTYCQRRDSKANSPA